MAKDILQSLIDGGLLLDWSEVDDEKFSFRVDDRPDSIYTVKYSYSKTKKYPLSINKISQVELYYRRKNSKNPYLKFNLFGQEDPEDVAAWIIKTILSKSHYNKSLEETFKEIRQKNSKRYSMEKVWGEYYDMYEFKYITVILTNKKTNERSFLYIYGPIDEKTKYRIRRHNGFSRLVTIKDNDFRLIEGT